MDFKSLLSQLDQLNEATEKTKTGIKHTAEPGGYGRKDDEDDEGNKVKAKDTEKKGRGRPKKATSASGEDKKYDFSAFGVKAGKDVKLPKWDKKKTKKHSIKEYLDQIEKALNESEQPAEIPAKAIDKFNEPNKKFYTKNPHFARGTEIKNIGKTIDASGKPVSALATKVTPKFNKPDPVSRLSRGSFNTSVDEAEQVTMEPAKQNTQVIKQGTKTLGTVSNPQLAAQIKQSIGKGEMSLAGNEMHEGEMDESTGDYSAKKARAGKDIGKPGKAFSKIAKDAGQRYGSKAAGERVAGAVLAKLRSKTNEADMPPRDALASPLTLESRAKADNKVNELSVNTLNRVHRAAVRDANDASRDGDEDKAQKRYDLAGKASYKAELKNRAAGLKPSGQHDLDEAKKPDANKNGIPDYAEDGKGKNDLKKKKVKEGMDQRLQAARSEGKAHGLRGHSHCGKNYEDMEEARCYHEGYKEGLDECYGQMPIQGYVGETDMQDEVDTMAAYGALGEEEVDESPFSWAAKNTPKGDKFSLGGKEFVKNDAFAFESWDKQLNALLEGKEVTEGMSVSISKGQQGSPDSVSVTAQDGEADQLLSVIKSAGLGLFGGDDAGTAQNASPMTVDTDGEPAEIGTGGDAIEVVGDHDGMMSLMKKLSGIGGSEAPQQNASEEETCETCGESACGCHEGEEIVDEVESEDQMTYQVAEDNPPDSGEAEEATEIADTQQANAAAAAYNPSQDIDEGGDGGEASDVGNVGVEAGDAEEEMKASMNEEDADEKQKDGLDESSFFNLYKKLSMLSEESTAEKDDKAEKAAKKVAKDIEYDEGHKGKDDDKAEEAGKKVKKDIEYDDKKDDKEKVDESYANSVDDTFETDIDFMVNVITGGLNKRKSTGQTTIPVVSSQLNRTVSHDTTDINESSDSVSAWKKLAGIK